MTSVPKPLKFLRPHYEKLTAFYDTIKGENENKVYIPSSQLRV